MSLWDDVKKNVVELYAVTSEKTTEIAKVSSRRWDKFGISRDIERQFGELGNLVYTGLQEGRDNILEDEAVAVLMARIGSLEQELKLKEEEIARIHKEHRERKAAEAAAGGTAAHGSADSWQDSDDEAEQAEVVLKDPALTPGKDESAILVEPVESTDDSDVQGEEEK